MMNSVKYILPISEPFITRTENGHYLAGLFVESYTVIDQKIELTGWVFGANNTFEVLSGDKKEKSEISRLERHDVIDNYKLVTKHKCSGFSLVIDSKTAQISGGLLLKMNCDSGTSRKSWIFTLPEPEKINANLNSDSLNLLGWAAHIESVDHTGLVGWIASADYLGRSIKCNLFAENHLIASTVAVIPRNDVIEFLSARTAFQFKFFLGRINLNLLNKLSREEHEEELFIEFSHSPNRYFLSNNHKRDIISSTRRAANYFEVSSRGEIEIKAMSAKSVEVEASLSEEPNIKAVAFYLPQFHTIPENDLWWGKGFTEWTNVARAKPAFNGHYQPHIPSNLGFYDASQEKVILEQVQLAEKYGLYGFCFHYYWFSGKRVLNKPIDTFINSKHKFKFMFCWANENWTRRWDGLEADVLMNQEHDLATDISFIEDILPFLLDDRYITRADGSKWLVVYRPSIMKNSRELFSTWKEIAHQHNIKLHISTVDGFEQSSMSNLGVDSYIQFPPLSSHSSLNINERFTFNPKFDGVSVHNYEDIKTCALANYSKYSVQKTSIPLVPGVMPGWDNSARKASKASIVHGNTPRSFYDWVKNVCKLQRKANNQIDEYLFINAWNEWAEGAHLEPDTFFGEQYLSALNQGLMEADEPDKNVTNIATELILSDMLRCGAIDKSLGLFNLSYFSTSEPSILRSAAISNKSIKKSLKHHVDSLNGSLLTDSQLTMVFPRSGLNLVGWLAINGEFQHKHPVFFCLHGLDGERYWTMSSLTYPRGDVITAINGTSNSMGALGYTLNAVIDDFVKPNKYDLYAYVMLSNKNNRGATLVDFYLTSIELS